MMNNNKILTVSYGTFSCTLEGFEDSFGTMKAIAEYFRDLAADDRYFGAEPPQPDADMLARIAQREVSRKVSARQHEGKIVLSALEDQREAAPEAPADAPVAEAPAPVTAEAPAAPQVDVSSLITPSPAPENLSLSLQSDATPISLEEPEATPEIALTEEPAEEEVAVEEAAEVEPTVEEAPIAEEATVEEPQIEEAPEAAPEEVAEVEEDDLAPEAEAESFFAESPSAEVETEEEIEEPLTAAPAFEEPRAEAPAPRTGGQSIAEKLQRIRAVVAKTQAEAEKAEAEDYLEDEHAVAADGAESRTEPEMAEEETPEAAEAAQSRHDLAALLDAVQEEEEDETPEAEVAETPAREGRLVKMKRADLEAAVARGALEEDQEETSEAEEETAEQAVPALDEIAPAKTDRSTLSPEKEAELARELAALEADIEAELAEDEAEEETDWESAEAETAEEHAETDAEAAEAEAEADDAEEADTAEAAPAAPLRRRPEEARRLPDLEEKAGSDMDRLLAEADHKMDEPEGANRRDAFAHLRAAVAAKKADVAMGKPEREARSDDAYRSDLAEVVRPRRPEGAPRRPRPTEGRPAPLKLVAEQRIDGGRPANAGPVRPRRVAAVRPEVGSDDGSFADYAQEMGATSLPQLLEAAASYMSFVEGLEQFSRPQLMTKVRQAGAEGEFSREDGLRSFGQLLRAGKIEKIKGGRFTVSDEIGFRPDQRAAG